MNTPVFINSIGSVSPLGSDSEEVWKNYKNPTHFISSRNFRGKTAFAASLNGESLKELETLRDSNPRYKDLDLSVVYAILASRKAFESSGWQDSTEVGINIGSSRGATGLFEKYHDSFVHTGKAGLLASPATTLGNISSWVAQDLHSTGPEFSHSVTCSTGLHAVLNGVAWLQAGMAEKFLVGGSEAALTPFTIAQMRAMKIYALEESEYPCRALDMKKSANTMVLGEGAGIMCLSKDPNHSLARIEGIGYATEALTHPVSISANAECFQKSMKMAMGKRRMNEIDAIVMHAPGTIKGDLAEVKAVKEIFGDTLPAMTTNKWKIGHTFGASGILSMEMAILMIQHQEFIPVPYDSGNNHPDKLESILVNAVGFGGNAVSILLSRKNNT